MIKNIYELKDIVSYLEVRGLLNQYKKAKNYILDGNEKIVQLKYREPKILGIMYFRINKQFRAFARIDGENLIIFKIDNHQD